MSKKQNARLFGYKLEFVKDRIFQMVSNGTPIEEVAVELKLTPAYAKRLATRMGCIQPTYGHDSIVDIICHIIKAPAQSDAEIAHMFGRKPSSITKIRHRLIANNMVPRKRRVAVGWPVTHYVEVLETTNTLPPHQGT